MSQKKSPDRIFYIHAWYIYKQYCLLLVYFLEQKELCSCQFHSNKSYIFMEFHLACHSHFLCCSNNLETVHDTHMAQILS